LSTDRAPKGKAISRAVHAHFTLDAVLNGILVSSSLNVLFPAPLAALQKQDVDPTGDIARHGEVRPDLDVAR